LGHGQRRYRGIAKTKLDYLAYRLDVQIDKYLHFGEHLRERRTRRFAENRIQCWRVAKTNGFHNSAQIEQLRGPATSLFENVQQRNFENLFCIRARTKRKFQFVIKLLSVIGFAWFLHQKHGYSLPIIVTKRKLFFPWIWFHGKVNLWKKHRLSINVNTHM